MYTLTDVTKNYQKGRRTITALRGLNLVIGDGEWLAVQGRTGHGKSTLLHILGGLDRPSTGTVTFAGHDLSQLREAQVTRLRAESIGFIFQTFNLVPTLSAAENAGSAADWSAMNIRPRQPSRPLSAGGTSTASGCSSILPATARSGLRGHQGAVPGGRPTGQTATARQASRERAFGEGLGGVYFVGERAGLHSGVLPHYLVDLIGIGIKDADAGCAAAIADGADESLQAGQV
jgi:ABC-type sugar transport system ATPase subunit